MEQSKVRVAKRISNIKERIFWFTGLALISPIIINFFTIIFIKSDFYNILSFGLNNNSNISLDILFNSNEFFDITLQSSSIQLNYFVGFIIFLITWYLVYFSILAFVKAKYFKEDESLFIQKNEENQQEIINLIYSDEPLNYKTFDAKLLSGNKEFKEKSEAIFKEFLSILNPEKVNSSQVISLTASWGAGKTSFFRVLGGWYDEVYKKEQENQKYKPEFQELSFYEYNPWMGQTKNLTEDFLNYLKSIIYTESEGDLIDTATDNYIVSLYDNLPSNSLLSKLPMLFKKESISFQIRKREMCEKIDKILNIKLNKRILILIDNIDRLTKTQILEMLEMVKDVADFPNITFVLAYDEKAVHSAIEENLKLDPSHYLEKIISDEFELKWSDSHYEYLENIAFKGFYESIEDNYKPKIKLKDNEKIITHYKNDIQFLFGILNIEVFRKKYLTKLINQDGVVIPDQQKYVYLILNQGWDDFAKWIKIISDLHKDKTFEDKVKRTFGIFNSYNEVKSTPFQVNRLVVGSNLNSALNPTKIEELFNQGIMEFYSDLYLFINVSVYDSQNDNKLMQKKYNDYFYQCIRDRFTIRFMKKFFKEFDKEMKKPKNQNELSFEEIATLVRNIVDKIW